LKQSRTRRQILASRSWVITRKKVRKVGKEKESKKKEKKRIFEKKRKKKVLKKQKKKKTKTNLVSNWVPLHQHTQENTASPSSTTVNPCPSWTTPDTHTSSS